MGEEPMPSAIETSVAIYLSSVETDMTAISARPAQRREWSAPPELFRHSLTGVWLNSESGATAQSAPEMVDASTVAELAASAAEPLTQADLTVAQLLRFEHMEADWDGIEAAKPLPWSLKDARLFIRSLAPESLIPRPTLHADGHAILFFRGNDVYAELEFLGQNRIGFYAQRGEQQWNDEFYFDGRSLPEGLSKVGFAILQH